MRGASGVVVFLFKDEAFPAVRCVWCSLVALPGVPLLSHCLPGCVCVHWRSLVFLLVFPGVLWLSLVLPLTFPVAPWRAVTLLLGALQLEPRPFTIHAGFLQREGGNLIEAISTVVSPACPVQRSQRCSRPLFCLPSASRWGDGCVFVRVFVGI